MRLTVVASLAMMIAAIPSQAQVMLNQIDTFSGGLANWQNNAGLATVQMGGPGGATDPFLRIATNGAATGPGSLMVGFNSAQWKGNYAAQNVGAIEMDLKNINFPNGGLGMSIRIALRTTANTGSSTPAYVSDPLNLLADNAWHHAAFLLNESNFTPVNSPPPFATMLAGGVGELRILHNPLAESFGASTAPTAAQLGIDNIHAAPVPEPGSMALCGIAIAAAARRLRRRS